MRRSLLLIFLLAIASIPPSFSQITKNPNYKMPTLKVKTQAKIRIDQLFYYKNVDNPTICCKVVPYQTPASQGSPVSWLQSSGSGGSASSTTNACIPQERYRTNEVTNDWNYQLQGNDLEDVRIDKQELPSYNKDSAFRYIAWSKDYNKCIFGVLLRDNPEKNLWLGKKIQQVECQRASFYIDPSQIGKDVLDIDDDKLFFFFIRENQQGQSGQSSANIVASGSGQAAPEMQQFVIQLEQKNLDQSNPQKEVTISIPKLSNNQSNIR